MARVDAKVTSRPKSAAQTAKTEGLPFKKMNYYLFAVALVVIVLGYITLASGSITIAPILLVLGYCVIVPVAILYRGSDSSSSEGAPTGS